MKTFMFAMKILFYIMISANKTKKIKKEREKKVNKITEKEKKYICKW